MRVGSKHSGVKVIQFTDFSGGLNYAVPSEALANNECVMLLNWEYDFSSGVLKTRDGLEKLGSLTDSINQLYYAKNLGVLLVSAGGKLYKYNDGTFTELGDLSENKVPVFVEWGDKVLIASGGYLQSTDGLTLTTITKDVVGEDVGTGDGSTTVFYLDNYPVVSESETIYIDDDVAQRDVDYTIDYLTGKITFVVVPEEETGITADYTYYSSPPQCDYVNVQYGRVIVAKQGDDYLYWSGIGDETNWNFTGTDSDALQLEIGYKDGGNIVAIKMLSKDVIVFKDNKRIYRVVGTYPDWAVYEVSRDNGALSKFAVAEIGNSIAFIDEAGIRSLDTVLEYGDIKVRDVGEKINVWLRRNINPAQIRLWHVKPKGQVWVKPQNDNFIYVFHYANKAWTVFQFPQSCSAVAYDDTTIYVALGTDLYKMSNTVLTDDGADIQARLITKKIHPNRQFLLKRGKLFYQGLSTGAANLKINKLYKNLDISQSGDVAYLDSDIAYFDDDPVVQETSSLVEFRCNHRIPYLQPEITVVSGNMKLLGLILEVVEV